MKKFLLVLAVAATVLLVDSQSASARRGGRGGCGSSSGGGGCGSSMGGCGSCGSSMGGCGMSSGGCSSCGGGTAMGGCSTGSCGTAMGGSSCVGGVCAIGGGGASYAQANGNEATLVVTLPADATLSIDDATTSSISANRVFVTPALEAGKEYEYTLKAQVVRDGKKQIVTEKVTVRAGKTSQVELKLPATSIAAQ